MHDFGQPSYHDYKVTMTSDQLNTMLAVLAEAALADPVSFEREFAASLKALVQLQVVVAGLKTEAHATSQ